MVTALVSALTKVPVRADVAMTGEITLRGRVLPIGGLKEKLLAALRGGIRTVVIPEENRKDLVDLPKSVLQGLEIVPAKWIDEVLDVVLERPLLPVAGSVTAEAPAPAEAAKEKAKPDDAGADAGRAH
jgi:ATP-dependent Lon protease